ncbi:MAG: hypothetical protein ACI8P9_002243, partial [Parasphingorhabdus sp.]
MGRNLQVKKRPQWLFRAEANGMVAPTQNGIKVPKCGECKFPLTERGNHYED